MNYNLLHLSALVSFGEFSSIGREETNIIEGKYITDMVPLDEIENEGISLVITKRKPGSRQHDKWLPLLYQLGSGKIPLAPMGVHAHGSAHVSEGW